jgi:hypothetical protein
MGLLRDESGYVLVLGRPRLMVVGGTAAEKEETKQVEIAAKPVVVAACSVPHYCFYCSWCGEQVLLPTDRDRVTFRQSGCEKDRGAVHCIGLYEVQTHRQLLDVSKLLRIRHQAPLDPCSKGGRDSAAELVALQGAVVCASCSTVRQQGSGSSSGRVRCGRLVLG